MADVVGAGDDGAPEIGEGDAGANGATGALPAARPALGAGVGAEDGANSDGYPGPNSEG